MPAVFQHLSSLVCVSKPLLLLSVSLCLHLQLTNPRTRSPPWLWIYGNRSLKKVELVQPSWPKLLFPREWRGISAWCPPCHTLVKRGCEAIAGGSSVHLSHFVGRHLRLWRLYLGSSLPGSGTACFFLWHRKLQTTEEQILKHRNLLPKLSPFRPLLMVINWGGCWMRPRT